MHKTVHCELPAVNLAASRARECGHAPGPSGLRACDFPVRSQKFILPAPAVVRLIAATVSSPAKFGRFSIFPRVFISILLSASLSETPVAGWRQDDRFSVHRFRFRSCPGK